MKINTNTVAICLATYNGEKYLREQLDSIVTQTHEDWILFIRDDESKDNTLYIINEYEKKYSKKIFLIKDDFTAHSSFKNFLYILNNIKKYDFNYFMFCDQDDVWKKDKIQLSFESIKSKNDVPILVHTDLEVVNSNLEILGDSFFKYRALNPHIKEINRLLIQNNVTGCTMMWNKKLNDLIDLNNINIVMHDWWITLVAAIFGEIIFINKPTIMYRQHGNNVVGATKVNSIKFIFNRLMKSNKIKKTMIDSVEQAKELLNSYNINDESIKNLIENYSKLYDKNKITRIHKVFKYKFLKQGLIQVIGELIFI